MESRTLAILLFVCCMSLNVPAQKPEFQAVGLEAQLYPAGYILGFRYDRSVQEHWSVNFRFQLQKLNFIEI